MKKTDLSGRALLSFDSLPSTNTYLRDSDFPVGTVVRALSQSEGRGRRGNTFHSQGGLYFSMKLPRSMPDQEMWAVNFIAANAVCDAIAQFGGEPRVKWVNDVYLSERKVCGILCEVRGDCLILGIGVNVSHTDFPEDIRESATTLEDEGIETSAEELLERIVLLFDGAFTAWDLPSVLRRYRERSLLTGREITYLENGERRYARVTGIADNGNLLCEREGATVVLHSGEVHTVRSSDR